MTKPALNIPTLRELIAEGVIGLELCCPVDRTHARKIRIRETMLDDTVIDVARKRRCTTRAQRDRGP